MKEILCITHKYPPTIGGMEKQSYELIKGLEQYYKVHKIVYVEGDGNKLLWFANLKSRVKVFLSTHPNIKLIHLNDGLMAAACTWLVDYVDIPVVATYHGLDITFPLAMFQNGIIPKMTKLSGGIAVSAATKNECVKRGFDAKKMYTVANGVDHDLANIIHDPNILQEVSKDIGVDISNKRIVVTMGRTVKRKGFSWFLKNVVPALNEDTIFLMIGPFDKEATISESVMKLIPKRMNTLLQLLLGTPSDQQAVRGLLNHNDIKGKAYHIGKLPFKKLMQVVSKADLFVMPNIKVKGDAEGFGLVALEASLRGTPVLASGIEGITEAVIDGGNGILLETKNSQQWISTINNLLADEVELGKLSIRTKKFSLENYSWSKMVKGYVEVFEHYINIKTPIVLNEHIHI